MRRRQLIETAARTGFALSILATPSAALSDPPARLAASAGNRFALDLYQQLAQAPEYRDRNLFLSPHSISTALAMALAGARGQTGDEIADVLGLAGDASRSEFMASLKSLVASLKPASGDEAEEVRKRLTQLRADLRDLQTRQQDLEADEKYVEAIALNREQFSLASQIDQLSQEVDQYELTVANAIWVARHKPLAEAYLETMRRTFGIDGARPADFAGQPDAERERINKWGAEQTRGRVPEVLPAGSISEETVAVLTNAIYFKGDWRSPFDKAWTEVHPFHLPGGEETPMDLMSGIKMAGYAAFQSDGRGFETPRMRDPGQDNGDRRFYPGEGGFQVAELSYRGGRISMVVVLPTEADGLPELEARLSAEALETWLSALDKRTTQVWLPKFRMRGEYALRQELRSLGMVTAFDDKAELGGMTGPDAAPIMISDVHHATFLEVDEVGTEAAAATALGMVASAVPIQDPLYPVFRADRPFLLSHSRPAQRRDSVCGKAQQLMSFSV